MILASDIREPPRTRTLRWAGAAVVVVAIHLGCAALALLPQPDDAADDAAAGPVIVEMLPMPVIARVDTPDVAHGPLMEEAQLTPQPARETKEDVQRDLPRVDPSPAPEPEVALPMPRPEPEKKPEEEQPQEEVTRQVAANQTVAAPLTRAPPRVDAEETRSVSAPAQGASPSLARVQARWEKALVAHLNRFKRYPESARARRAQGAVSVTFTIDRTGRVIASSIVKGSGSSPLDDEALAMLQRASPLPAPPTQISGVTFNWTLPIQFSIR